MYYEGDFLIASSQKFLIEKDKDEDVTELAPRPVIFQSRKGPRDDPDNFLIAPDPEVPGREGQAWIGHVMG